MLPPVAETTDRVTHSFNPHPARELDATRCVRRAWRIGCCFNPHPARELDATSSCFKQSRIPLMFQPSSRPRAGCYLFGVVALSYWRNVSTLIPPESWMLPSIASPNPLPLMFQPSSRPRAGCYLFGGVALSYWRNFSTLIPPESWMLPVRCGCSVLLAQCFNPHPARELDATQHRQPESLALDVSTLIPPESWMLPPHASSRHVFP